MFKYLSITTNLQEMMIMLKSLPTCTIVLDKKCKIVEINQSALVFLNVRSKDDYRVKRIGVLNDPTYMKKILNELIRGRVIRDKTHFVDCANGQFRVVNFSACMIEGLSKMFIFQFFELEIFPSSYTEFQNTTSHQSVPNDQLLKKGKQYRNVKKLFDDSGQKIAYHRYLSECTIQLFARKYSGLTHNEVIICTFLASNLSVDEISKITNKLASNVSGSIYRIIAKFQLESRQALYALLKHELPYNCD
jgi:DNA-binding CsgD family transcriptional regulator